MQVLNLFLDENYILVKYGNKMKKTPVKGNLLMEGRINDRSEFLYILGRILEELEIKKNTPVFCYFLRAYLSRTLNLPDLSKEELESMLMIERKEYFGIDEEIIPIIEKKVGSFTSVSAIYMDDFEKLKVVLDKLSLNLKKVFALSSYVETLSDGAYIYVGSRCCDLLIKEGLIVKSERILLNALTDLRKENHLDEEYFIEITDKSFDRDSANLRDFFMAYDFMISDLFYDLKNKILKYDVKKVYLNDYISIDEKELEEIFEGVAVKDFNFLNVTENQNSYKKFNFELKKLLYVAAIAMLLLVNFTIYKANSDRLKISERSLKKIEKELENIDVRKPVDLKKLAKSSDEEKTIDFSNKFGKVLSNLEKFGESEILYTSIKADEKSIVVSGLSRDESTIKMLEDYLKDFNPTVDYEKKDAYYFTITMEEQ